jgi:nucleoredoxin
MSAIVVTADSLMALVNPQHAVPSIIKTAISSGNVLENSMLEESSLRAVESNCFSDKIIGLYFSAHWCPPCRGFTPRLAERYRSLVEAGHAVEIVFISSDQSEAAALEYFHEMPWKMLSYSCREEKQKLSKAFNVSGIPSLVLLDESMKLITLNGREALMTCDFECIKSFETDKQAQANKLAEQITLLPGVITCASHPHPLKKLPSVYSGQYGCDVCHGSGSGWVYHCHDCGWDAHPMCACPGGVSSSN